MAMMTDRDRRRSRIAWALQGQLRRIGDRIDATRPLPGYYNAKENRRRESAVAALQARMVIVRARFDRIAGRP